MPATRATIERWLDRLYADDDVTHMIVRCDSFDYRGSVDDGCCYPVYVTKDEDVRKIADSGGDRLMEVYSANLTREEQMAQRRAFNYG